MNISVDKAVVARLEKAGQRYEVLVDPDKALQIKSGKSFPSEEWLATPDVYHDQRKGEKVPADLLNKTFGTNKMEEIAIKIIRDGDVQLTTDQRHKMMEDKIKAVAAIISREGINPQTNAPHPQDRVMRAMEEVKVRLELGKRPEEQVDTVLKAIQKIIPIKFERVKIVIKIPAQFAGHSVGTIRRYGTPSKEEWLSDGSYACVLELSAGMQAELFDKLSSLTHGQAQVKQV